jgi:hypothetical protein
MHGCLSKGTGLRQLSTWLEGHGQYGHLHGPNKARSDGGRGEHARTGTAVQVKELQVGAPVHAGTSYRHPIPCLGSLA